MKNFYENQVDILDPNVDARHYGNVVFGGMRFNDDNSIASGSGSSSTDESQLPFGLQTGLLGMVKVYNACIRHADFSILPSALSTAATVQVLGGTNTDRHYICCRYARFSSLEVVTPALSAVPSNSVEYLWFPIAEVYLDSTGIAVVPCRLIRSMIILPGEI